MYCLWIVHGLTNSGGGTKPGGRDPNVPPPSVCNTGDWCSLVCVYTYAVTVVLHGVLDIPSPRGRFSVW